MRYAINYTKAKKDIIAKISIYAAILASIVIAVNF